MFLPWATVAGIYSESGTESEGVYALPLAVAGAAVIATGRGPWRSWLAALIAAGLIGIGVLGVMEVRDGIEKLNEEFFILGDLLSAFDAEPKVGIGLILLIASAVAALVMSVAHGFGFSTKSTPAAASSAESDVPHHSP